MKIFTTTLALEFFLTMTPVVPAEEKPKDTAQKIADHQTGSKKTAASQDSLAADVQQLKIEQTDPKVIELLDSVETMIDEACENLLEFNTGGETIAAQTEVIEKIFEAAKKKQSKGESQGAQGMMEMMKRMMGEGAEGDEKKGDKPGEKPGQKPGEGITGESDSANTANGGPGAGQKSTERRVPKASGDPGQAFPEEYRKALDAYNRALTK
jgi:ribosomal protein L17